MRTTEQIRKELVELSEQESNDFEIDKLRDIIDELLAERESRQDSEEDVHSQ